MNDYNFKLKMLWDCFGYCTRVILCSLVWNEKWDVCDCRGITKVTFRRVVVGLWLVAAMGVVVLLRTCKGLVQPFNPNPDLRWTKNQDYIFGLHTCRGEG
jgi:hypothetical protein